MKSIFKSPESIEQRDATKKAIFLAGSIEMDQAVNWQKRCEEALSQKYILFNPRRESWDNSWEQSINNTQFKEQVTWELNALENSDCIIMFIANNTKSPISLLELGLFAQSGKMKVVVEDGFWRKGNVDIVCERYGIEQFNNLESLIENLMQ